VSPLNIHLNTIHPWTRVFHKLFETLTSILALKHLQDFIYYAYTFYTGLLEEQTLRIFRSGSPEALGDLVRYHMAVAAMVTRTQAPGLEELTTATVSIVLSDTPTSEALPSSAADHPSNMSTKLSSASERPAAHIDDSPGPSVSLAAGCRT
jgi:protein SMG6